ncbi:MAG TPA: cytochrome c3 family protein [Terriglobia bacterium]|nr:cytochrome c3 family protein [Terriglobia bacterium]
MPWIPIPLLALWIWTPAAPQSECLACHSEPGATSSTGKSLYVEPERFAASAHSALGCAGCHAAAQEFPHPEAMPPPDCSSCHAEATQQVAAGVHQSLGTASCQSCHGPIHEALPASEPASAVAKANLPSTCGACHANPDFLSRHGISFARPVEAYRQSVHAQAVAAGNDAAPSCSNCHGSHAIFPARDARSSINHWNVPATCGACHAEIYQAYQESVHGDAVRRGASGAPVCTDCHGEHAILAPTTPESPVSPARVSTATCERCHADERLAQNYNLPLDRVPSFENSYHGLAARAGSQTVANCASCHGVHNILPSSDPRSTVHPANLSKTCGQCHPGAGQRFALGRIHVLPGSATEHPAPRWIRRVYLVLIPLIVGVLFLHNAIDFLAKLLRPRHAAASGEQVMRMNLHFRIAHWLTMLSFPALVVTGFALKFPEAWWAAPLLRWESSYSLRGGLHRAAGVILLGSLCYHLAHLACSPADRRILRHLRPGWKDVQDFGRMIRHNLGLLPNRPLFGKFSYAEKIEYWAFLWGVLIMGLTGLLLWFNTFTLRFFPGWVADAATVLHYYEAILATLAVLVWHFYFVIFDPDVYPMDHAWLTGKSAADHLRQSRPGYVAELLRQQSGGGAQPPEADSPASGKETGGQEGPSPNRQPDSS